MRLHAVGGLCNRLRAILSYRAKHGPITVRWGQDAYVDFGAWSDVFSPIEGVTIVDSGPFDVEDFAVCGGAPAGWERAYTELRLEPLLAGAIERFRMNAGGEYDAIHVRRTDHTPLAKDYKQFTPTAEFETFVAQSGRPVYVATDNAETQRAFRVLLGSRARTFLHVRSSSEAQAFDDHRRNTSLTHAVADLYLCAGAVRFKGSGYSSFSETIEILRRLAGKE